MVLSWATKDALQQLDALVTRKVQLEGHDAGKVGKPVAANPFLSSAAVLPTSTDVNAALKLIQSWLQKFVAPTELHDVFDNLMAIAVRYNDLEKKVLDKGDKPSTKDAAVTIDDKYDDSVTFFILDTLTKILQSVMQIEPHQRIQDILPFEQAPQQLSLNNLQSAVPFAFGYLHHSYSSAIRNGAGRLLGVLSFTFLGTITALFTDKLLAAKKDDQQRDYASYQPAIGYLEFGVGDQKRALETNTYLYELSKKMKDIDRGILRQEICSSLIAVYNSILSTSDAKRIAEWEKFVSTGGQQLDSWNTNYKEVYDRVSKWSSKDKHSLFCWELMLRMIVLNRHAEFYLDKKKNDVFSNVLKGLSKKEFRHQCLILLRNYVRDVPMATLQTDMTGWSSQAKAVMQTLFGKKSPKPEDDEIPIMTEIFIEVGKKYPSYVITDVIADILKPESQYYTRQKNISLIALGAIVRDKKSNETENIGLSPLLLPFIEDARNSTEPKQIMLMKAALRCWPSIRGSTPQQVQQIAALILPLTFHEDREVSTLAITCLQEFVLLDMNLYYQLAVHALIDQLNDLDATQSIVILKTCNNLIVMLQTLLDYLKTPPPNSKPFSPKPDAWTTVREHMEAVAMVRLTHTEGWVRSEILRVLLKLNSPQLVAFEEKCPNPSQHLIESLLPNVHDSDLVPSTSEVFYAPLLKLINTPTLFAQFKGIIAAAWSYLYKTVSKLNAIDAGERPGEEWTSLFNNEFLFLCLAVRPGEGGVGKMQAQASTSQLQRTGSIGRSNLVEAHPSKEELLLKFQQFRERCNKSAFQGPEVYTFFDQVVTFLQSTNHNAYSNAMRATIAADFSQMDVINHTELLNHLRGPLTPPPAEPKSKIRPPTAKEGFYYHTYTLDLLSRLIIRVSPDLYHAGPTLLTRTLDDLITQWSTDTTASYTELPALTRYYMASLFTRYIFYRTVAKQHSGHISKADILNRRSFFFSRIVTLLEGADGGKDIQVKLESAVLSGACAILAVGLITDKTLGDNILSFLEQQLTMQPPQHIHDGVTLGLQLFMRLNPNRLTDFIRYTLPETHDPTSIHYIHHGVYNASLKKSGIVASRPTNVIIARYYAKALSAGFVHDYAMWTVDQGITSAEIILVSLLLMNSSDGEVRQAALILVQEIVINDRITLGEDARLFSPASPFMYTPGTIKLAHDIAYQPRYLIAVPAVFRRAVDLFTHIQEQKKEILLRLLHSFAAQFSPLIRGVDSVRPGETMSIVDDVMDSLFAITRLSTTSGILSQSLKELWIAVLSIDPITPQLVGYVLNHLINHYSSLLNETVATAGGGVAITDKAHPPASQSATGSPAVTPTSSKKSSINRQQSIDTAAASSTTAAAVPSIDEEPTTPTTDKEAPAPTVTVTPLKTPAAKTGASPATTPKSIGETKDKEVPASGGSTRKLLDISEDRVGDVAPMEIVAARDILLEKALLRMIATHLSRGDHSMLIINGLVEKLRKYPDECPNDPAQFLTWFTEHHQPKNEPTSNVERSAFELIVHTVFERSQSDLEPSLPTLLLNAYVLFPGSQLSDELLKNICLALKMLDVKQSAEVVISEAFFINNLSATHPELREDFSQAAFIWSLNSRDPAVATAAFRIFYELEQQSFYFGVGQSTLIRVILLIYACLKNKETRRLKSIIQTCLLPTEQLYDQQGWSALLTAAVALLSSVDITIYQLGLQLFQHLFNYPIPAGRKKAWLVALGPFLATDSGSKTAKVDIETGAIELLFRGLTHPITCDETLSLLQTLLEYYANTGSMASRNKIGITVELMNVLLRCVELQNLHADKAKTGVQLTEAQSLNKQKQLIRGVIACTRLSATLFDSADTDQKHADQFTVLANIFKNVALSLSLGLPDVIPPPDQAGDVIEPIAILSSTSATALVNVPLTAAEQQAQLESSRSLVYRELQSFLSTTGPIETVGALSGTSTLPTPTQVLIPFFRSFTALYDTQEHFNFVISLIQRLLLRYYTEWKTTLLMMLGRFLLETQYNVNIDSFVPLSELVAQSYYSSDKDEQHLAENLGYLLVQKRGSGTPMKMNEIFNLIRTRASLRRPIQSTTTLAANDEKIDSDLLLQSSLTRFQQTAFPVLQQMNEKARQVDRKEEQRSPRALKVSPSPSVLKANNNAAEVAEQVGSGEDWHTLDALLSSGVHGGKSLSLATIDLTAPEIQQKPAESEEIERKPFSSLLTIAASATRQQKAVEKSNPFAAEAVLEKANNPFGYDAAVAEVEAEKLAVGAAEEGGDEGEVAPVDDSVDRPGVDSDDEIDRRKSAADAANGDEGADSDAEDHVAAEGAAGGNNPFA